MLHQGNDGSRESVCLSDSRQNSTRDTAFVTAPGCLRDIRRSRGEFDLISTSLIE
jgi:hypothetical protein